MPHKHINTDAQTDFQYLKTNLQNVKKNEKKQNYIFSIDSTPTKAVILAESVEEAAATNNNNNQMNYIYLSIV